MITLAMATVVAAPRSAVWGALTEPGQIERWRPGVEGLLEVSGTDPLPGRQLRFRCRLQGVPVALEEIALEAVPDERLRCNVRFGLFHCEETFVLAPADPAGGRTRVSLRITTASEMPLLGASLDRFAVRRFATELSATCLRALRDWCELGHPPGSSLPASDAAVVLLRDPA